MATKFLEPGGDATFNTSAVGGGGMWFFINNSPAVATDFVHGGHIKSIKYRTSVADSVQAPGASDTGTRISFYMYLNAKPTATAIVMQTQGAFVQASIRLTSAGVVQFFGNGVQVGSNGPTLATGAWNRICMSYTVTSLTVNRFEVFVNGTSAVSVTNASLGTTGAGNIFFGNVSADTTLDMRTSDHYVDDSSSLTDTGDIWVTAKRPFSNGTTNGFTTQVGSGGSGYGTGHAPQVNERPSSTTNGWSIVAVAATTEEYNIEGKSVGDIDISTATIVDYMGWVYVRAVIAETGTYVLNGATPSLSIPTSPTVLYTAAGSTSYPAGTGTDIGVVTSATATTVTLSECGIMVAYKPGAVVAGTTNKLTLLSAG